MSESENVTSIGGDQPQASPGDRALDILNVLQSDVALRLSRDEEFPGRDETLIRDARAVADLLSVCDSEEAYGSMNPGTVHQAAWLVSRLLTVATGDVPVSPWRKREAQEDGSHD